MKISTTTLLKRIISIAKSINPPIISKGKEYEVDEMCTYIRHKRNFIWLVYALEKDSKNVVSFNVGKRTNKTLSRVLDTLKLSGKSDLESFYSSVLQKSLFNIGLIKSIATIC